MVDRLTLAQGSALALRRTPRMGEVQQSMTGTRQRIAMILNFRKSNKTHQSVGLAPLVQVGKKNTLYSYFNKWLLYLRDWKPQGSSVLALNLLCCFYITYVFAYNRIMFTQPPHLRRQYLGRRRPLLCETDCFVLGRGILLMKTSGVGHENACVWRNVARATF